VTCIAGMLVRGESVANHALAQSMLDAMKERAPDGMQLVCRGPAALGQAFLRTGSSGAEAPNRQTLDGEVWIAADARIDGRGELLRSLRATGREIATDAPHAELILHAYMAFGDRFLDHLIGDFAFALWDARMQRLVCARDQFGVRPFYFAQANGSLFFASDMDALHRVPGVTRELDESAVADFLLIGLCTEPEQTIYRDIRCLPPATRLDASAIGVVQQRYWSLGEPRETRYRDRGEYVEHFTQVFEQAVNDRLPEGPVAVHLSGGMDCTSIAAVAAARDRGAAPRVTGYHVSSRRVEPADNEGEFARMVADHLGIPMMWHDLGDHPLFARVHDPVLRTAFPLAYPHLAVNDDMLSEIVASGARVVLTGYSGDAIMTPSPDYHAGLLRQRRWLKLIRESANHLRLARTVTGLGLRALFQHQSSPPWKPPLPAWLASGHADIESRWARWWSAHEGAVEGAAQLRLPWIHRHFEATEALKRPAVARHPFHDLRLIDFALGLPNSMRMEKRILRDAMRGRLPEAVRSRPKSAAAGDPVRTMVTNGKLKLADLVNEAVLRGVTVDKYLAAWDKYCSGEGSDSTWTSWLILQPIAFGNWLSQQQEIAK
jgi:asparagine synthase (glutamine-hydrolysing)